MPTPVRIQFGPGGLRTAGGHAVYTVIRWAELWVEEQNLDCLECEWTAAPTLPTATLSWLYGRIKWPAGSNFITALKRGLNELYVKVTYDTDDEDQTRDWYGIIDLTEDRQGGIVTRTITRPGAEEDEILATATGEQLFTAYGMEKLVADHEIRNFVWEDAASLEVTSHAPPPFNHKGKQNRTASPGPQGVYLFEPNVDDGRFWSTKDIIDYLLVYQTPTDSAGTKHINWAFVDGPFLTWDRPELPQENRSTYSLIDSLLNRRRLLMWSVRYRALDDKFLIVADTLAAEDVLIPLPGASAIPANNAPRHYVYDKDQLTSGAVKDSEVELVDQVRFIGARRRSVGTFSLGDYTIEEAVTGSELDQYQRGASTNPDYASWGTKRKQRQNQEARNRRELLHVYSLFRIPKTWDHKTVLAGGLSPRPLFPLDDNPAAGIAVFHAEMEVEQTLPLIEGVDYSAATIYDGEVDGKTGELMAPFAVFMRPETEMHAEGPKWVLSDEIGQSGELEITELPEEMNRWSANLYVPNNWEVKGFRLTVSGQPRHVIDGANFTRLPEDPNPGKWTYRGQKMLVTLSILDQRYLEAIYPTTAPPRKEHLKIKTIQAGDGYRKDYVAPNTVVGVGLDGKLVRTDGGWIPKPKPDDHEHRLRALAKIAAEWYTRPHHVLAVETYRMPPPTQVQVGDLVMWIGDETAEGSHLRKDINSPVTSIRISSPRGTPDSSQEATMRITTSAGELDPLQLDPPAIEDRAKPGSEPVKSMTGQYTVLGRSINQPMPGRPQETAIRWKPIP